MNKKLELTSIEDASLIRKFSVLFIVMSLLPFLIIAYLFTQLNTTNTIIINEHVLVISLFLVGLGILVGFWGIRKSIVRLRQITKQARDTFNIDKDNLEKIEAEENEITQLVMTLEEVVKHLEDDIRFSRLSKQKA